MRELDYGDKIQVGDKVAIGKGMYVVNKVDSEFCYVRVNKHTSIRFPDVYSQEFKNSDDVDTTAYIVYRG